MYISASAAMKARSERLWLKYRGLERPIAIPRYSQFELPNAGHKTPFIMAGPEALTPSLSFARAGPQESASRTSGETSFIQDFIR